MWDYICPKCRKTEKKNSSQCVHCGEQYGCPIRVPPRALKDPEALEDYVHRHVFPRVSKAQRDYLAQYFTELFSDGFESGDFSEWTGTVVSDGDHAISVQSTIKHQGTYTCKSASANTNSSDYALAYKTLSSAYQTIFMRVYARVSALPSSGQQFSVFKSRDKDNSSYQVLVGLWNDSGTLKWFVYNRHTATFYTYSENMLVDTWYCLELKVYRHATSGELKLWRNGTNIIDQTGLDTGDSDHDKVYVGYETNFMSTGSITDVYLDCVVVADAYIGPEEEGATYTKTWNTDVLFKKLGIIVGNERKSTVVTDTDIPYATQATFQRKTFYANGRFWVFYAAADNNIVFRTSTDGLSWSSETVVRVGGSYGPNVSIFFDGTYVHYAANSTGSYPWDSALYYRRGTPNSNGTITWSAVEQTVNTDYDKATNPAIAVDSNGYVWIGYREYVNGERCPFVIKSGNNDGTWGTTPAGFPYQLSATETSYWTAVPVPLTSGKMLVIYAHHLTADYGKQIKMRAWTGSSWLDEVTTTSGIYHSMHHSAVAEGDNVHIVFCKFISAEDPMEIVYVKYSYSSNSLGSETTLQGSIPYTETYSDFSVPIIAGSNGKLYVFWANYPSEDHLYYRKWNGSSWESAVDWINESSEMFSSDSWTCFYQAYDGYIGILYETKQSSPYNVKFACMPRVVTVDALFKKPGISKSLSIDAAIQKQDIVDTFAVDVALQKALLETYDVNALFRKHGIEKTADVDVLLQKLDILATFGVDVNFLKQNIIKSFGVDARFGALVTQEISRQIDVLFKKLDILETFGVDIDFLKRNVIKSFTLDICFSALITQTISKQIDVLLKMLDATKTFGLDVYFGPVEAQAYVKTFALDVMFAYKVRLPELWLDENGKIVLNISKPYTWVGT